VLNAISGLYTYLGRHNRLSGSNPMTTVERPRVRRRKPDPLTAAESDALLSRGPGRPQQRIAVWLLRWSGVRVGEAVSLYQRDVDLELGVLHVRESKTDAGVRDVPILAELRPELLRWLGYLEDHGHKDAYLPLLCTRTERAMSDFQVYRSVKIAAARAGVRPGGSVSPHTLRRTFATDLLNRGVPLEVVSRLLGHESTRTTQASYAELQPASVLRALAGML
jgi:integrase/recombinase XerD